MSVFNTKLKRKDEIADGTTAFYFEKPQDFHYKAGQHVNITLLDPPETDDKGNTRIFTLASAPHEPYLMIATRIRDTAFKRVLKNMEPGTPIKIDGPLGSFVLHPELARPAIFLAGGIGITPFRSILTQAVYDNLPQRLYLFYSNRRPEDTAFLRELVMLEMENKNFKLVNTMTDMEKSSAPWDGERGYIDNGMITKYTENTKDSIYYIAGPPAMIFAMKELLTGQGVDEGNIRYDNFFGY